MPALQQVGQLGRGHRHFAQSTPPPLLAIPLLSIIVKLAAASVCTSAAATRMDLWRCASVSQCPMQTSKSARCNGWNGLRATSLRKAPISGTRGRRRPLRRPRPLDLPVLRKGVSYCLRDAHGDAKRSNWPKHGVRALAGPGPLGERLWDHQLRCIKPPPEPHAITLYCLTTED